MSKRRFGFNEESLRPYFELNRTLKAVYKIAGKLFGVQFKQRFDIPTYTSDVFVYEVSKNEKSIGLLYFDPFERPSKRQGAWMGNYRVPGQSGAKEKPSRENAHVTIVTGFRKGEEGKPTLLSLDEVTTIAHELGHGLHSLLSTTKYKGNSMESATWDFIELPSQFMEDWVYEREIFFDLARHYETGKTLDEATYQKILESKTFMGAKNMLGQLRYGILDLEMYRDPNADLSDLEAFEVGVLKAYSISERLPGSIMLTTMQHIVSGSYAVGYYSYMWANRIVADAFKYFKDNGGFNAELSKRFLDTVMSQGDLRDADELYREFRGRDPDSQALLDKYGIK